GRWGDIHSIKPNDFFAGSVSRCKRNPYPSTTSNVEVFYVLCIIGCKRCFEGGESMRKYLIGFVVGLLVFVGTTALADEISNVGKKIEVEVPVVLNGEELLVKAVAFEGTSYLPVRAVAESLGLEVDYKDGVIYLEGGSVQNVAEEVKRLLRIEEVEKEIARYEEAIKNLENEIVMIREMYSGSEYFEKIAESQVE